MKMRKPVEMVLQLTMRWIFLACVVGQVMATLPLPVPDQSMVHYLNRGDGTDVKHHFQDSKDGEALLQIFCREGDPKSLRYYFRSAKLRISSSAEDFKFFRGATATEVYIKYLSASKWYLWAAEMLPWRVQEARFPTFNSSCVGVSTSKRFTAILVTRPVDPWNLALFVGGVSLFFLSARLAKSALFFYASGTLLGGVTAVLVLLFILSRSLPKGKLSYLTISVLWTMCLYFAGESWNRLEELFHEKLPYILVYVTTGAVFSFITCYRVGPPSHPKTLDIIRWFLQAISLGLIHLSSELVEVSTAFIVFMVFTYYFARRIKFLGLRIWRRIFPAEVKLLTEEEYIAQATVETEKGLRELREYCSSPECNSWKIVSRLKNPKRFASFVDGDSHLSDDELLAYESFAPDDDEEDYTTEDEDEIIGGDGRGNRNASSSSALGNSSLPRSPSRQGTPRPRVAEHPPQQRRRQQQQQQQQPQQAKSPQPYRNGSASSSSSRSLRSGDKVRNGRVPRNEYLTDDDSPNNTLHTDDDEEQDY